MSSFSVSDGMILKVLQIQRMRCSVHRSLLTIVMTFVLACTYSDALAWKHGSHHVVAARTVEGLPDTGFAKTFKDAMAANPEIVAFASNGPDFGFFNIPGVFYKDVPWADRMHYDRVGSFTRRLVELALDSNDPQLIAFAGGYITHVAGDIMGHSKYVNTFSDNAVYLGTPDSAKEHQKRELYSDGYVFNNYYKNKTPARTYSPEHVQAVFAAPANFDPTFDKLNSYYRQAVYDVYHIDPSEVPDMKDWFKTFKVIIDARFNNIQTEVGADTSDLGGVDLSNIYDPGPMNTWIEQDPSIVTRLNYALDESVRQAVQYIKDASEYLNPARTIDPFRDLTDYINLDAGIDGRSIGTLVVNINTKNELFAGSIDDVYFGLRADDGNTWWTAKGELGRLDFLPGDKSVFYLYVYQNQFNYPLNRIQSVCLKKAVKFGDDWEPENLTVRINGLVIFDGQPPKLTTNDNLWCSSTTDGLMGEVQITTGPPSGEIFVDGKTVGYGYWRGMLPTGPHTVSYSDMSANGFNKKPEDTSITVTSSNMSRIIGLYSDTSPPKVTLSLDNCTSDTQCATGQIMPNLHVNWIDNGSIGRVLLKNLSNGQSREFYQPSGTTGQISTPTPVLSYGDNVLTAEVYDQAGNRGHERIFLKYDPFSDNIPPSLNITSHADNQHVATSSILLAGTASDGPTTTSRGCNGISTLTVNGASDWSPAVGSDDSPCGTVKWERKVRLQPGANTITVRASDKSGLNNATEKTITIHSDLSTYYDVTVSKTGLGTGIVTSAPFGIACGTTCSYRFPSDETVILKAESGTRSYCSDWTGCDYTTDGLCAVRPTQARNVSITCEKGDFLLNGGSRYTKASSITIDINNIPGIGTPDQVQVSPDGTTWSAWVAMPSTKQYTLNFSGRTDKITIYARFKTGSVISDVFSASITHDNTPPVVILSTLPDQAITADPLLSIKGTISDSSGIKSLLINKTPVPVLMTAAKTWEFTHTIELKPGLNYYRLEAIDLAGNITSITRSITLNSTDLITITSPADGTITTQSTLDITATLARSGVISATLNGVDIYSGRIGTNITIPIDGSTPDKMLKDGINTITVTGSPLRSGQNETASRTVYRIPTTGSGITRPILEVTSPVQDLRIKQFSTTDRTYLVQGSISLWSTPIAVTINVNGNTYELRTSDSTRMTLVVDQLNSINSYYTFQQEITLPEEKTYHIAITVSYNGNNGVEYYTVRRTLVVDTAAPVTMITPPPGIYIGSVKIALGSSKPGATIYYSLDGTDPQATAAYQYIGPFSLTASDADITKTLKYFSVDQYGLQEALATRIFTVQTPVPRHGACGAMNGQTASQLSSGNYCATGAASPVSGSGPWTWNCLGSFGGTDASCSAEFGYLLSVILAGSGSGGVNSHAAASGTPDHIACPIGTCSAYYPRGTLVEMTAAAGTASTFDGWSGNCTSSPCRLTIDAPKSVTATFTLAAKARNKSTGVSYSSLTQALVDAQNGEELDLLDTQFTDPVTLIKGLVLSGGWNSQFSSRSGVRSTLNYGLGIISGDSFIENIDVRGKITISGGSLRIRGSVTVK